MGVNKGAFVFLYQPDNQGADKREAAQTQHMHDDAKVLLVLGGDGVDGERGGFRGSFKVTRRWLGESFWQT